MEVSELRGAPKHRYEFKLFGEVSAGRGPIPAPADIGGTVEDVQGGRLVVVGETALATAGGSNVAR